VGLGGVETQAGVNLADANGGVDAKNSLEICQGVAPEVPQSGIGGPELGLEAFRWDKRRFPEIAHPVGKLYVKVDGERGSL